MRDLKGDWKDLFNGFMLALDLRKMFLGFCAILFTVFIPLFVTCWFANRLCPPAVQRPANITLREIASTVCTSWHVIYSGVTVVEGGKDVSQYEPVWYHYGPYTLFILVSVLAVWAYFGGAIARIAAVEIAKDGERIETGKALRFAARKFWSFFMSPWICVIGFLFFAFCNFAGGFLGRLLDFVWIGGPLAALLTPLALISGFIMALIAVGTLAGHGLFKPAVAAEGTDAFDAVSRGFSYVYSKPWHYLWYNLVSVCYGWICISFVIVFAVTFCHFGLKAGACGFDLVGVPGPRIEEGAGGKKVEIEQFGRFSHVTDVAWGLILDERYKDRPYKWCPPEVLSDADPYGRLMNLSNKVVQNRYDVSFSDLTGSGHKAAAGIVLALLVIVLGIALGYLPSYCISQQTAIYFLLRKKVDGIEMNEVYDEPEEEKAPEPVPAAPAEPKPPAEGDKK